MMAIKAFKLREINKILFDSIISHLKAFYAAEKVGIFVCPGQWRYRLRRLNNEAHSASAHHSKKAASSNAASKPGPWRVELLKAKKL
jgi:hypothetical protein